MELDIDALDRMPAADESPLYPCHGVTCTGKTCTNTCFHTN